MQIEKLKKVLSLSCLALLLTACESPDDDTNSVQTSEEAQVMEGSSGDAEAQPVDFAESVQDRVYYAFDQASLTPEARQVLEEQAGWLKQNPNKNIQVAGYCDKRGSIPYNDRLGQMRADTAGHMLVENGVDPSRIATVSYGNRVTLVEGSTEEAYAMNRTAVTIVE